MIPLSTSLTATFDANGKATAKIGPQRSGQSWLVTRVSTMIGTSNNNETLKIYLNYASPSTYLDGTRRARQDTSETAITIPAQESLVFEWENGTPGTSATAIILGSIL